MSAADVSTVRLTVITTRQRVCAAAYSCCVWGQLGKTWTQPLLKAQGTEGKDTTHVQCGHSEREKHWNAVHHKQTIYPPLEGVSFSAWGGFILQLFTSGVQVKPTCVFRVWTDLFLYVWPEICAVSYLTAAVVVTVPFLVGVFGIRHIVASSHYSWMALRK